MVHFITNRRPDLSFVIYSSLFQVAMIKVIIRSRWGPVAPLDTIQFILMFDAACHHLLNRGSISNDEGRHFMRTSTSLKFIQIQKATTGKITPSRRLCWYPQPTLSNSSLGFVKGSALVGLLLWKSKSTHLRSHSFHIAQYDCWLQEAETSFKFIYIKKSRSFYYQLLSLSSSYMVWMIHLKHFDCQIKCRSQSDMNVPQGEREEREMQSTWQGSWCFEFDAFLLKLCFFLAV